MAKTIQGGRAILVEGTRPSTIVFLTASSVIAGWVVVMRPASALIILSGLVVMFLVLSQQVLFLVPMTTLALAVGSSSLVSSDSSISNFKFLMVAAVAVSGLLVLARTRRVATGSGIIAAAFGLVFFAFVSSLYSTNPRLTFEHSVALSLLFLSALVAVPLLVSDTANLIQLVGAVALTATALIVGGMVLDAAGLIEGFQVGRFQGLFQNPNMIGAFLAPVLPVVVILGVGQRQRRKVFIVAGLVLFLALLLSGSRGGLLSSTFGMAVGFAVARNAKRALLWILMAAIAAGAVISYLDIRIRPEGEGLFEAGTGSNRLMAWEDGMRVISERPLIGHGFGVTLEYFPEVRTESLYRGSSKFFRLHSSFLETALELGWLGAGYLVLLATSGVWRGWRLARARPHVKWLVAALAGGIAGGAMEGVFEAGLLAAGGLLAFHFWILVGAVHSLSGARHKLVQ
ncbi:MAG: O-antigen ligase family protein [Actinobacteria bacterium]|nr:O-antigen ligase family protein [Actinomycetota bacterium]